MTDWEDLLALLDDAPHDELVVETDAQRHVFRRIDGEQWVQEVTTLRSPNLLASSIGGPRISAAKTSPDVRAHDGLLDVCAPLPGIFYRAPKPGAAPFVEIGARITNDMVVGIIETMKLMNSVAAGVAGEIAQICLENGSPVEAGDVIMRARPDVPR